MDTVIHMLGWKVGTSRGTACGLEWDSPAMLQLAGKPLDPKAPSCPFFSVEGAERVTCPACREKIARMVDTDIARAPGSLPK